MSQKSGRRSRRATTEEEIKAPPSKGENGAEENHEVTNGNGSIVLNGNGTPEKVKTEEVRVTRSQTPQKKKIQEEQLETLNGNHQDINLESIVETEPENAEPDLMDPLIVVDEPDPELIFEESDLESGNESPVLNRCQTRRSASRNIPTPKTPQAEAEESKDVTFETFSENLSTNVEVGSDSTRLEYAEKDISLETNSFLTANKNRTFAESLRHLSSRKSIRPISETHRKALQNNMEKTEIDAKGTLNLKRKQCNGGELVDVAKRAKTEDSPGFFSRLSSPLASFRRNHLKPDVVSSTPKLTGYKDDKFLLENENESKVCEVRDPERRWCSIM